MSDVITSPDLVKYLLGGGIAVIPTDTIYGIVARAEDPSAVKELYSVRRSAEPKPFIVLISQTDDIRKFGCHVGEDILSFLRKNWPGKVSVVLSCPHSEYSYLHLGTKALAFRVPKDEFLITLIGETGPLVAPSANPPGKSPARTIAEARRYFGNKAGIYIDAGVISGAPSTLVSLETGRPHIIREGAARVVL